LRRHRSPVTHCERARPSSSSITCCVCQSFDRHFDGTWLDCVALNCHLFQIGAHFSSLISFVCLRIASFASDHKKRKLFLIFGIQSDSALTSLTGPSFFCPRSFTLALGTLLSQLLTCLRLASSIASLRRRSLCHLRHNGQFVLLIDRQPRSFFLIFTLILCSRCRLSLSLSCSISRPSSPSNLSTFICISILGSKFKATLSAQFRFAF
jgi:hypothetical protein